MRLPPRRGWGILRLIASRVQSKLSEGATEWAESAKENLLPFLLAFSLRCCYDKRSKWEGGEFAVVVLAGAAESGSLTDEIPVNWCNLVAIMDWGCRLDGALVP